MTFTSMSEYSTSTETADLDCSLTKMFEPMRTAITTSLGMLIEDAPGILKLDAMVSRLVHALCRPEIHRDLSRYSSRLGR